MMEQPQHPDHHVALVLDTLSDELPTKYMQGQREHGGNLWRKPVLDFMGEEVLDMVVYYDVLRRQNDLLKQLCREGMAGSSDSYQALQSIYNVLTVGNPEGVKEEGD